MAKIKTDNSKLVAILSYITLIGWVIALILNNQNRTKLGSFHIRQALLLLLIGLVVQFFPVIGWILSIILFVFWIMGLISAIKEEQKEVPFIGSYAQDWFKKL